MKGTTEKAEPSRSACTLILSVMVLPFLKKVINPKQLRVRKLIRAYSDPVGLQ